MLTYDLTYQMWVKPAFKFLMDTDTVCEQVFSNYLVQHNM